MVCLGFHDARFVAIQPGLGPLEYYFFVLTEFGESLHDGVER